MARKKSRIKMVENDGQRILCSQVSDGGDFMVHGVHDELDVQTDRAIQKKFLRFRPARDVDMLGREWLLNLNESESL